MPPDKRAGIAVDPVVGDLQVMRPAVHEDAAAALRAVGDAQAIDARRVALEVARERVCAYCCCRADWRRLYADVRSCQCK